MRDRGRGVLKYAVLVAALLFFVLPVVWIALTSFKSQAEVFSYPPVFVPEAINLRHYAAVLNGAGGQALKDSLIVASANALLSIIAGVPAAYGISRWRIGGQHFAMWILSIRMFPPVVSAIPLFLLFRDLQLLDTYLGLIIAYVTLNVPFVVWFMKSFFDDLPRDLEEAALVDGANRWQAFARVVIPLAIPAIVSSALLAFVFAWNEFLLALFLTRSAVKTLPIALSSLVGGHEILWGQIGALAVMAILPVIVLVVVLQRYVVRGLSLGAVEG